MRVTLRIRTGPEKQIVRNRPPNRRQAHAAASFLWPLAFFSFFVCAWRWAYELGWLGHFLLPGGALCHWQIWFTAGAVSQTAAVRLGHYAARPLDAWVQRPQAAAPVPEVPISRAPAQPFLPRGAELWSAALAPGRRDPAALAEELSDPVVHS